MQKSNREIAAQPYKYIICLDTESTCWPQRVPLNKLKCEIIEIAALLVNLETGDIEAEFDQFLKPTEKPILSEFCTNLTGITQQQVDRGILLKDALTMFHEWLFKALESRNLKLPQKKPNANIGDCAFLTWTDVDFYLGFPKECQRKQLHKPIYFNQWINLEPIYHAFYRKKPKNFRDALAQVGLEFEGRAHSGLYDARNLAKLATKMAKEGAHLAITKEFP